MPRNTIALGIRPPQPTEVGGGLTFDPIRAMEGIARTQNELNQAQLFNQTFAAKMRLGQLYSSAPDEETGMEMMRQSPDIAFDPEMLTQARQAHLAMVQVAHERQQMGTSAFENFNKMLPVLYQDPSKWDSVKSTVLSGIYDPKVKEQNSDQLDSYFSAMTGGTGGDPNKIRQNILGGMMSTMSPEQMKMYTGGMDWQDVGGGRQVFYTPGVFSPQGAGPQPVGAPIVQGRGPLPITQPTDIAPARPGGMAGFGQPPGPVGPVVLSGAAPAAAPTPAPDLVPGGALGVPPATAGTAPSSIQLPQVDVAAPAPQPSVEHYGTGLVARTDLERKMAEYEQDLNNNVSVGQGLRKNMDEIYDAAKQVHLGGGADTYMKFAKALQALGVRNDTVDKWAAGGLAPLTVIDKLSLQDATGQMRTQLETGRYNRNEFIAFLNSNPGITTDPRAMVQVFNLWNQYFQKNQSEQAALNKAKDSPGFDITRWPAQWSASDYMKKFSPTTPYTGEGVLGVLPEKARDGVYLPQNKQEFDELPKGARYRKPGWGPDQSDTK